MGALARRTKLGNEACGPRPRRFVGQHLKLCRDGHGQGAMVLTRLAQLGRHRFPAGPVGPCPVDDDDRWLRHLYLPGSRIDRRLAVVPMTDAIRRRMLLKAKGRYNTSGRTVRGQCIWVTAPRPSAPHRGLVRRYPGHRQRRQRAQSESTRRTHSNQRASGRELTSSSRPRSSRRDRPTGRSRSAREQSDSGRHRRTTVRPLDPPGVGQIDGLSLDGIVRAERSAVPSLDMALQR
jgi:hypothetical protein